MRKLFVVARKSFVEGGGTETRSEWAIFAETPEHAAMRYINPTAESLINEGDVPDEWYDTDVLVNKAEVFGVLVFGPYEVA